MSPYHYGKRMVLQFLILLSVAEKGKEFSKMKKMKYCIAAIFAVLLLTAGNKALAAPICPVPQDFTQPDGNVITVTAYGDEFFSWREDENGNIIAYDVATDSYKYAEIKDGKLVPTFDMVGKSSRTRRGAKKLQREDILPLWENAERFDYSQKNDDGIQPISESTDTVPKKLLTLLIEFSDVKLKYDADFWAKRMYSTDSTDISVVNYWKENADGVDVFEPADTSGVLNGMTGTVSRGDFVDVGYTVTKCPQGVVKVSLNMPHPIKTWDNKSSSLSWDIEHMAIAAINACYNFADEMPYPIFIFAGYNETGGTGIGEIHPYASIGGAETPDGFLTNRCVTQGKLGVNDVPAGIGITCHELGHSAFYLPDLYFSFLPNAGWTNNGLMYCSLMSTGCWGSLYDVSDSISWKQNIWRDPYAYYMYQVPTHLDPWCKMQCGFISPTIVDEWDGDINSISANGADSQYNVLMLRSKAAANQYFLIENRQFVGYDNGLQRWNDAGRWSNPFEGGIIIYHVDEGVFYNWNNDSIYHHFIMAEHTISGEDDFIWEFVNTEGRNRLDGETSPSSDLHELKTYGHSSCSKWKDCHPQTLKSGISIEVLGNNGPSVRVAANVDEEYRLTMIEGARFTDLFPDTNFCCAVLDILQAEDNTVRAPDDVLTVKDWIILASLTHMDISEQGIKDLTGIEFFSSLDRLACVGNKITHIDISKNSHISFLNCGNNRLTELDASNWEHIAYLRCENNQLTNLDVSRLGDLTLLYCSNNLLTELDVSSNRKVSKLDCNNNLLTQLNVANNPELSELYCSNNRLTELDISGNPVLYDLACSNNFLTSLNTSHNPDLEFLECADNKLTGLNLIDNLFVQWLWCYGNYMDAEAPRNSVMGLEPLLEELGSPLSKDAMTDKSPFVYFPQNVAKQEHNHIWAVAWTTDETHHWHNCTADNCPVADNAKKDSYGVHVYDGNQDTTCNICGYVRTVTPPVPISPPGPSEPVEPDLPDTPENCSRDENCALGKFTDTDLNAWYHNGVHYCLENGLMSGYGNGKFGPNDSLSRGMLAQILYSQAGKPSVSEDNRFDDVASGVWYAKAVAWAAEQKIVAGYGDDAFGPDDPITREQLAVMLWRYAGSPATHGTLSGFTDQGKVSRYATDALCWAVEKGILFGKGNGILDPEGEATRAEAATMLYHYFTLEE